ncbi:unnamed protein product [Blepharisma stoltei]|uniref:Core Histone H2A/H2B/H3 domain-containing protein n=1 Tax=Blepharisma stoltei TaxID=1481888 RepID=A0AAU9J909_9CILI|nr:unnamed protein product [Blepharisma stoltei]
MKPKTGDKKDTKNEKAAAKDIGETQAQKKSSRPKSNSFVIYIHRLLKQVHPDLSISKKSMNIMSSFVNDLFERLSTESANVSKYSGKKTLTSKEVLTSIKLLFPGEIGVHAMTEAEKAINKYSSSE